MESVVIAILLSTLVISTLLLVRARRGGGPVIGDGDLGALHAELREESRLRATAEERAARAAQLERNLEARTRELAESAARVATLETQLDHERTRVREEQARLEKLRQETEHVFSTLSKQALEANSRQFLEAAKRELALQQQTAKADFDKRQTAIDQLVKPLQQSLDHIQKQHTDIERRREGAYQSLLDQVRQLETTTSGLAGAMRTPKARGRWGELQLRRMLEHAGMVNRCHFTEQASTDAHGGRLLPDVVVHLAGDRDIVIDAKTPMDAYLDSIEAADEATREAKLSEHARRLKEHVKALSRKEYTKQFDRAPDFVVMFLPNEGILHTALEQDPALNEFAWSNNVVLATPQTLMTMLLVVRQGWAEQSLAESAREISQLGTSIFDRIVKVAELWQQVGAHLERTSKAYNKAVSSMDARLVPAARKLQTHGIGTSSELPALEGVEETPRDFTSPELLRLEDVEDVEVIEAPALRIASGELA